MKTLLPQFSVKCSDKSIRKKDTKVKQKRKQYSDRKTGAKRSTVKTGHAVLVKQPKKNKLTLPFNPNPGVILEKKDRCLQYDMAIKHLLEMCHISNRFQVGYLHRLNAILLTEQLWILVSLKESHSTRGRNL